MHIDYHDFLFYSFIKILFILYLNSGMELSMDIVGKHFGNPGT